MRMSRLLSLLVAPLVAGCSTLDSMVPSMPNLGLGLGQPSFQAAKTTGLTVADEPFAAQAGASVLAQGGSAADAVSAMFIALSATYPVAAGLGGGGICLVRDAQGRGREFDFLARAANSGGGLAVPGAVAGFADLQKAYGTLPWQRVVAPGEAYAATGFPISHVLALRLQSSQNLIRNDAGLRSEFLDGSGRPKAEGTVVSNRALSVTLGTVRLAGADGFYSGTVAAGLVAASAAAGAPLSAAELSGYRASQAPARTASLGSVSALVPGPSTGAGAFIAGVIGNLGSGDPEVAVVGALRKALAGFNIQSVPPDLGATSFAALDSKGQAAACAVTMNGPFGSGRTAGDTGVGFAASPATPAGLSSAFLTPMIGVGGGQTVLAGAGSGGPNGSGAILYALLRLAAGQRIGRSADLLSTGLAPLVTANTIACQNSLCVALPDPGGNGLGARVDDLQTSARGG
ncbi:MAG TPA: gamma-glutamyltransferase [Rhizomicrobium sp.]|nr:gamma-glutamyltransferase [Rhizomicrobium sp.]